MAAPLNPNCLADSKRSEPHGGPFSFGESMLEVLSLVSFWGFWFLIGREWEASINPGVLRIMLDCFVFERGVLPNCAAAPPSLWHLVVWVHSLPWLSLFCKVADREAGGLFRISSPRSQFRSAHQKLSDSLAFAISFVPREERRCFWGGPRQLPAKQGMDMTSWFSITFNTESRREPPSLKALAWWPNGPAAPRASPILGAVSGAWFCEGTTLLRSASRSQGVFPMLSLPRFGPEKRPAIPCPASSSTTRLPRAP